MKLDKRRKYYLVLDCETATLPYAGTLSQEDKKKVAIAKPLIYDLGWQIIDRKGTVYARKNYLITEIFSVPQVFNTAYYANKKPLYLKMLQENKITLANWATAIADLVEDMQACEAVGAYNAMFDFKKAIPFTELYINYLYSEDFYKWEQWQNHCCDCIADGTIQRKEQEFDEDVFRFRGVVYPLFDLWGLTCRHLLNCNEYKQMCVENKWNTASGKYFKTSAETAFRYLAQKLDFDEAHTALDDAEIESKLFAEIARLTKNKWTIGIIFFPFRELGTVEEFLTKAKNNA